MSRLKTATLAAAGAAAITASIALSTSAYAVAPATTTATFNCNTWGSGSVTLTATDTGGVKKLKLASTAIKVPAGTAPIGANTIATVVKVTKNGVAGTTQFSGTVNPPMVAGGSVTVGPLPLTTGTLAAGDKTNVAPLAGAPGAANFTVSITPPGVPSIYCTATGAQASDFTW
ncbi:hypothetical protein [Streptomyces sp. NPDC054961]